MDSNSERHETTQSTEPALFTVEQVTEKYPGFRCVQEFAESSLDDGAVIPAIQKLLLGYWKRQTPAFGTHCQNEAGETRYCVFAKEIDEDKVSGIIAGRALLGAVVVAPLPPINH